MTKSKLITNILSVEELTSLTQDQRDRIELSCNRFSIQTLKTYCAQIKAAKLYRKKVPGTIQEIIDVIHHSKEAGVKPATISLRIAALKWFNNAIGCPIDDDEGILQAVMREVRRDVGGQPKPKGGQVLSSKDRLVLFKHLIASRNSLEKEIEELNFAIAGSKLKSEKYLLNQNLSAKKRSLYVIARNHIMFLLMAYSSQRPEAIREMKFTDIKEATTKNGKRAFSFFISHLKSDRQGTGRQTGWIIDSDDPDLSLGKWLDKWKKLLGNDDGYIIRGGNGMKSIMNPNRHAEQGALQVAYKKYRDEAGLPHESTLYTFRRSFITTALQNDTSKVKTMSMTLHEREETMTKHYLESGLDDAILADDVL